MRNSGWLRRAAPPLLLALSGLPLSAHARPAVNVALKASFNSAPYLVELLETAAEENATAYFPILDRIADAYFADSSTDEQLHARFLKLLRDDGHVTDPNALSSFEFALAIHSAAPRVQAHLQYYDTSVVPSLPDGDQEGCGSWTEKGGRQYCGGEGSREMSRASTQELPFDRILGDASNAEPAVLYADITTPEFAGRHKELVSQARAGKISYRLRHKPSKAAPGTPLTVSGYGVALDLKRTDYIVIDDRKAEEAAAKEEAPKVASEGKLESDEEIADLKPLSSSEVSDLAMKAASFIMASDDKLETMLKLTQDFPKHSSFISAHNVSEDFEKEFAEYRRYILGMNVMWINGVQIEQRKVDAFSFLDHLRRERKLINDILGLGLTGPEAIKLLSHEATTEAVADTEPQRFDWRDDTEDNRAIIWLNNIEKDKRYDAWPDTLQALLQRTFPGQLPSVRRNLHNIVISVDLSHTEDPEILSEMVQNLIRREVPLRWGIVPMITSDRSEQHAKVVYHLLDSYGLAAVMKYLAVLGGGKADSLPSATDFASVTDTHVLRKDKVAMTLPEVLQSEEIKDRVALGLKYVKRLALNSPNAPVLANGIPIPRNDEWLSTLSQRVGFDLRLVQREIFENELEEDFYVPSLFLAKASLRRNPLVSPENDKDIRILNLVETFEAHENLLQRLPQIPATESVDDDAFMLLVGDVDSEWGQQLFKDGLAYRKEHSNIQLLLLHNPNTTINNTTRSGRLANFAGRTADQTAEGLLALLDDGSAVNTEFSSKTAALWSDATSLISTLGLQPGEGAVLLNGRLVAPITPDMDFGADEFETLYEFENRKRLLPFSQAVRDVVKMEMIPSPLAAAKLSSLVARSTISDVPDGLFDGPPMVRTSIFEKWNGTHTSIEIGDKNTAVIQIVAAVDPASETAQRWVPLLKALSELNGVYLRLFLNPTSKLSELPVKRFYRYVLNSKPVFTKAGAVQDLTARFSGIPAEALLTMAMDVPAPWLVAPKDSVQDLDNIKLSLVSGQSDIEAIYELENILIEGHCRDVTSGGMPPRGVQLIMGTAKEPHFADTIVMANLGYFQFKANPGFYNIELMQGRSQEIFNIESLGTQGYNPIPGDNRTEIALMSFQGATLFPRLTRKEGQEMADVLDSAKPPSASDIVDQGSKLVDEALAKAGIKGANTGKYVSQGLSFGSKLLGKVGFGQDAVAAAPKQADINIFSVASGHLYERMLNIMMVSVMRHTKHTVKFWFIEQFLSPSFKEFLPIIAKEYGFEFEMVTFKWPHWLRGQKEKQREIWGYKILFLDVLFPLDLDKVIFVDADQIVRTDMFELVTHDLHGAPYGFTPMCDSRTEMEGFRFWKQGYWKNFLNGLPYHISALYVVDLKRFRQIAAGDRLRQQYQTLSSDPASLSNLDQDLPNNMQVVLPIHSLPQEWLWCETWCSDESLKEAKTIDLCNNPQTKEPKLDRARRQVPEWTVYDDEIAALARRTKGGEESAKQAPAGGDTTSSAKGGQASVKDEL